MMTASRRRPWEGYAYFRRETLTGDHSRVRRENLEQLLARTGLPAGEWIGSAATLLGVSGPVTERQLAALFGEGLHPDAEQIIAQRTAAGDSAAKALRAARLGPAFGHYTRCATREMLDAAVESAARSAGRPLTGAEEEQLRTREAARLFTEDFHRPPEDEAELRRYLKARLRPDREPVAAFDLVFTVPKSASVLWALGDEATCRAVEAAHTQAVADAVAWMEANALAVRAGRAQLDVTTGLVGARFRHFDSRLGDPLLHDHVLVANVAQVRDEAGRPKWRRLDGKLLFAHMVAISEYYNQRVVEHLCRALGLRATAREATPGRRPTIEIDGVDTALIRLHSQRRAQIVPVLEHLLADYRARHGHGPVTEAARHALMRKATLATRPAKKRPRRLEELREAWRAQAVAAVGAERADSVLERARAAAAAGESAPVDVAAAAQAVVDTVSAHRAVFARRHLQAQARRHLVLLTRGRPEADGLAEQITEHAIGLCVPLTAPEVHTGFAPLTRADGTSVYRRRGHELYTTAATLADERSLIAAARTPAIPPATRELFDEHAAAPRHRRLNTGQVALARSFATAEHALTVAVGPAGSGKTSALRLVAETVRAAGGQLIALAPSSRAAQVLAEDLGQSATTLHRWLRAQQRAAAGKRIDPALVLRPGDVVVVDEAGMAGTAHLAAITRHVLAAGAHVRLLGDPAQLGAVEAGGILRWLAREPGTVHLSELHRFQADGEAEASLKLRAGEADAIAWYHAAGRLHGGEAEHMADTVFTAWMSDTAAGRASVMLAPDAATVDALNRRAQAWRAATGHLGPAGPVLRDGHTARLGDVLVTRYNQRTWLTLAGRDFVKNGDTWTLERLLPGGDAVVRHTAHRGRARLSAAYLAAHTELGYASTVHRAQGITVETCHALLPPGTSRESAYVAATRGRHTNHLYLPHPQHTPTEALARVLATSTAPLSAHQALKQAADDAISFATLAAQYADATGRADHLRLAASLRDHLGPHAEILLSADAWPVLQRALLRAERQGWSPGRILARTARYNTATGRFGPGGSPFHTALEPAALMAWRIDEYLRTHPHTPGTTAGDGAARPLAALTDPQLTHLATAARTAATRALSAAVTTGLALPAAAPTPERTAHLARTRRLTQLCEVLTARITQEQQLRTRLPDHTPPPPDHTGALPDWLADPAAVRDPRTPAPWRTHLAERRTLLATQLRATGQRLATTPTAWLRPLGTPPPPEAHQLRRAWEHAAALTAAWRALHRVPPTFETLGPRPADRSQHPAYDALTAHLATIAQHTRDHYERMARAADPLALRADAAGHLAALGRPRPRPAPLREPGPAVTDAPAPLRPAARTRLADTTWQTLEAEALARSVLQALTEGRQPPEEWMAYLPAPDPEDEPQQQLFVDLVAAIAEWRSRQHVVDEQPLGPEPADAAAATEWQHLAQALELYQASRIQDRLALLRARRAADRDRLTAVTRETADRDGRPARPTVPSATTVPAAPPGGRAPRRPGPADSRPR